MNLSFKSVKLLEKISQHLTNKIWEFTTIIKKNYFPNYGKLQELQETWSWWTVWRVLARAHTAGWLTWCELSASRYQHAHKPSVCCVLGGGWVAQKPLNNVCVNINDNIRLISTKTNFFRLVVTVKPRVYEHTCDKIELSSSILLKWFVNWEMLVS